MTPQEHRSCRTHLDRQCGSLLLARKGVVGMTFASKNSLKLRFSDSGGPYQECGVAIKVWGKAEISLTVE